jgi:hypothetical protein
MSRVQPMAMALASPQGEPDGDRMDVELVAVALEKPTPAKGVAAKMERDTLPPVAPVFLLALSGTG